jgi:hypothetical protein
MRRRRNRVSYAMALAVVIVLGLLSRSSFAAALPLFLSTYAGDTLWALALFLTLGLVFPGLRLVVVALMTIGLAFSVEVSQLYQAAWIDAIRSTRMGALVLGSGFKWSDLLCYTVGCLMGVVGEASWAARGER